MPRADEDAPLTCEECAELRLAAICSVDMTTGPNPTLDSGLRKLKAQERRARGC